MQAAYMNILEDAKQAQQRVYKSSQALNDILGSNQLQKARQQAEIQSRWQAAAMQVYIRSFE